jgi:hypothetical protein
VQPDLPDTAWRLEPARDLIVLREIFNTSSSYSANWPRASFLPGCDHLAAFSCPGDIPTADCAASTKATSLSV